MTAPLASFDPADSADAPVHSRSQSRQGIIVLGREIIGPEWAKAVTQGLRPRHYALDVAELLGLEVLSTANLVPDRLDRVLSLLVGRPHVWALARVVARSSDPDEFVYATDESLAIAILMASRKRRRRAAAMTMFMMAPQRTRTRFWLWLLGRLGLLPRTTIVGIPEVEAETRRNFRVRPASDRVVQIPTTVDHHFFRPAHQRAQTERPLIAAAGLEHRDYHRLADAVRDLDVDVVVCALSPDAKHPGVAMPDDLPDNIVFDPLTMSDLRDLYQRADVCVLSTTPNHFGAGLTTVLEALACGAGVVISNHEPDLAEMVADGHVLKAADNTPEALRDAIVEAVETSRGSARRARYRLSQDQYVNEFVQLFGRNSGLEVVGPPAAPTLVPHDRTSDASRFDPSGIENMMTVVIPVGHVDDGLATQLDALIGQANDSDFEIVISHNMATFASRSLLDDLVEPFLSRRPDVAIRIVEANEKAGAAAARNAGAHAARGAMLAFCDADDVVHAGWIDAMVDGLRDHAAVTGAIVEIAPAGQEDWRPPATPGALPEFHGAKYILSGNLAIRRAAFADIGGFDETLTRCEDIAMGWSLQNRGHRIGFAPDAMLDYHHRAGLREMLHQHFLYGKGMAEVLNRYPNPVLGAETPEIAGWKGKLALLKPNAQPHKRTIISESRRVAIGFGRLAVLLGRR